MRPYFFRWPVLARPAEDHPEAMPPRPMRHDPGPVTAPRMFAPMGPVNPEFDPTGTPHPPFRAKTGSDEKGGDR